MATDQATRNSALKHQQASCGGVRRRQAFALEDPAATAGDNHPALAQGHHMLGLVLGLLRA